jgi:hypothetical protein
MRPCQRSQHKHLCGHCPLLQNLKKRRQQQKSGAIKKLFLVCGVLTTWLAMQALVRVSRCLPNYGTRKSFVPYVMHETNLLILKGITCNPTLQAQN